MLITGYGEACFFLPCHWLRVQDLLFWKMPCAKTFQKAKGLTMFNICSGILGALLTKWVLQRCIPARSNRNVARHKWEQFCAGLRMGEVEEWQAVWWQICAAFFFFCFYSKWEAMAHSVPGSLFSDSNLGTVEKKRKNLFWTTPQPLHTKFSRLN